MKSVQPKQGWLSVDDIKKDRDIRTRLKIGREDITLLANFALSYYAMYGLSKKISLEKASDISVLFEDHVRFNEEQKRVEFHISTLSDTLTEIHTSEAQKKRGIN